MKDTFKGRDAYFNVCLYVISVSKYMYFMLTNPERKVYIYIYKGVE